jgi:hypothetical protein
MTEPVSLRMIRFKFPSEQAEYDEAKARERRIDRAGAKALAEACAAGNVEAFLGAVDFLNYRTVEGWRLGMMRVARFPAVSAEIQTAFLNVWIESKGLLGKVRDRPVLAKALPILMPAIYHGAAIQIYRGANWQERRHRRYGFSWTRDRGVARGFAEHWQQVFGGVVLETLAPPDAILLVREDEDYFDEREIVIDPFRLNKVMVIERLLSDAAADT